MQRGASKGRAARALGFGGLIAGGLLALALAAAPARARVYGYGDKVCLDVVEEFDSPELQRLYVSWAQGYFSAISFREGLSDFTRGLGDEPKTMGKWLKRYCERRNSKQFYEAVDAYAEELIKFGGQKTR